MAAGDDERRDPPEYNVYKAGSGRGRKGGGGQPNDKRAAKGGKRPSDAPEYSVYRSRRNPFARLREADLGAVRSKLGERRKASRRREVEGEPGEKPRWRKVLRFVLIGAAFWFLLSVVLFMVSAQIQKGKLNGQAADELGGNPFLAISPQTILVMGTDVRPRGVPDENGNPTRKKCTDAAASGDPHPDGCLPTRADTLLLVRIGGGAFEKLSIPRDTLAEVPGVGAEKINSAYASGGAALQIEAVEAFLGIDIDHAIILDFEGFADFIEAIGGVTVNLTDRLKSKIDGGAGQGGITLELDRGEHTLNGQEALAFARTRKNQRNPAEGDIERAERQQQVLSGIKDRLTSPWRAPINFIRGPWIGWSAPKAMVSDMGGFTLPQLAIGVAIGGKPGSKILGRDATVTPAGNLQIPLAECERAVRKFLGKSGPRDPICSPAG